MPHVPVERFWLAAAPSNFMRYRRHCDALMVSRSTGRFVGSSGVMIVVTPSPISVTFALVTLRPRRIRYVPAGTRTTPPLAGSESMAACRLAYMLALMPYGTPEHGAPETS